VNEGGLRFFTDFRFFSRDLRVWVWLDRILKFFQFLRARKFWDLCVGV